MNSLRSNDYFSRSPSIKVQRSRFDRSKTKKLTWNNGDLIPIYVSEILPGDTVELDLSSVVRMSTPVKPIMDNIVQDVFFFFVPDRLVWKHSEDFFGANKNGHWTPLVEYTIPQLKTSSVTNASVWYKPLTVWDFYPSGVPNPIIENPQTFIDLVDSDYLYYDLAGTMTKVISSDSIDLTKSYFIQYEGFCPGTLWDYMGLPLGGNNESVSQLPFRAYGLIWNEFFRDQSYMDPVNIYFDSDSDLTGVAGVTWDENTGYRPAVYDRVTDTVKGAKPLRVSRFHDYFSSGLPQPQFGDAVAIPLGSSAPVVSDGGTLKVTLPNETVGRSLFTGVYAGTGSNYNFAQVGGDNIPSGAKSLSYFSGMQVDLSNAVSATINDLREAFQMQRYLEKSARSGNLYIEILKAQFGVSNPDYRLQRPEYLGGSRNYLNVTQVLQTSSTDSTTPQGNTAAYSLTVDKKHMFTKSFTEHGYLIGLMCTRTTRSYQQGIKREWSRKRKLDFYFPVFSALPERAILGKELYSHFSSYGTDDYLESALAYQEAWAEYRYDVDEVCGDFRSESGQSLDFWHFSDYYKSAPYISEDWLLEGPENVDRTLAVGSAVSHQFLGDFFFKAIYTRPMPLYSIPGFADHF